MAPAMASTSEDRRDYVYSGVIPCLILAILSTILRLITRATQQNGLNSADILIIFALISGICIGSLVFAGINHGFGRHISTLSTGDIEEFLKIFFAAEIFYITTIAFTKMSILVFYCSIFPGKRFALISKVIGAVVAGWATACLFGVIFSCVPVAAWWDLSLKETAQCIDTTKFFIGNAIPNIITDIAILLLPIRNVWQLQMTWQKKVMVTGMFLLGSFVVIASILRLALLFDEDVNDPTFGLVNAFTWSNIEVDIAIVSANLPTLRPLVQKLFPSQIFSRQVKSNKQSTPDESELLARKKWSSDGRNKFQRLHDQNGYSITSVIAERNKPRALTQEHGIYVQHEFSQNFQH